jgi:hypothetical protein
MTYHDMYGLKGLNIEQAKDLLEGNLRVVFKLYGSDLLRRQYRYRFNAENFWLLENLGANWCKEPFFQEFPNYPIILKIDWTERPEEIRKLLDERFCMLEHAVWEENSGKYVLPLLTRQP